MKKSNSDIDKWFGDAWESINTFYKYNKEDELREGIIRVSSVIRDIKDIQNRIDELKEVAYEREKVLVRKFDELLNPKEEDDELEKVLFDGTIGMP